MTEATQVILNSILGACGAGIFTGICLWVKTLYKKSKAYDKSLKALAHDAYFRYCRYLMPNETLSEAELENFTYLYESYHALGLNGTGDKLYKQISEKPVKTEKVC